LLNPEKKASAIEQKKMLPAATSVKGSVMLTPSHVPVSACKRADAAMIISIVIANNNVRLRLLVLMSLLLLLTNRQLSQRTLIILNVTL
jgi:hypothetical protein